MSWSDLHRRTEILGEVITRAERNPGDPALFDDLPDLDRLFGGVDGVLRTLQYRWDNHLAANMDMVLEGRREPQQVWDDVAASQPTLRAVLDAWSGRRGRGRTHAGPTDGKPSMGPTTVQERPAQAATTAS
ncbi:MAG: hypothetical protein ICV72_05825 [Aldersonia sp.]|nr:hypothetical protein [Aldersonia sp.]